MTQKAKFAILLFYKFVNVPDAEQYAQEHLEFCKNLGVKGRILIADSGINGTLSGTVEQTEQYVQYMRQNPLFADTVFKVDEAEEHAFKKMHVRYKKELVTFRVDDRNLDPNYKTGTHLNPEQWHEYLQRDDVVVLDGRTGYEFDLGHFRNAIRPEVDSFREFPEWIRENMGDLKDKKILTYCTGGIRCEILSNWMLQEGFEDVYQLDGGIVTYGKDEKVQGRLFDGSCYVFDERISVPINHTDEATVVGKCHHCGSPADKYINCTLDSCHLQHIVCEECETAHSGHCSEECASQTAAASAV